MIRTLAQCMSFIYTIKSKSLEGRGYYENIIELQWNQFYWLQATAGNMCINFVLSVLHHTFINRYNQLELCIKQPCNMYTFSYSRSSRYFKVLVPNLPWRSFMAWNFFFYHWNLQKFIITWEVKLVILDLYYRTQFHLGILVLLYLYNIYNWEGIAKNVAGKWTPKTLLVILHLCICAKQF